MNRQVDPSPLRLNRTSKIVIFIVLFFFVTPFFITVIMSIPETQVLNQMEDTTKADLTIKVTGFQWKWRYEYVDKDISFFSTLRSSATHGDFSPDKDLAAENEAHHFEVDNMMIVPSGRKVRLLLTAGDVIHAWWVPEFGNKKDAIPGYINELWFTIDEGREGIYRGQCAELCGKGHAYMPVVVKVVSGREYDAWLETGI